MVLSLRRRFRRRLPKATSSKVKRLQRPNDLACEMDRNFCVQLAHLRATDVAWVRNPMAGLVASGVELYGALDVGGCPYIGIPMKQPDSNLGMDFAVQAGQQPRLMTKLEVAAYAQCTTRCIDNWMRRGYLPYFKIGRTVRFKVADVEAYLSNHFRVARRSRPAKGTHSSAEPQGNGSASHGKDGQLAPTTEVRSFSSATAGVFGGAMENHFAASSGRTNSR